MWHRLCIWPMLMSVILSFFLSFLFFTSGTLGPRCVPGPLRSPKQRNHPEQRQSQSSDNEQKRQLRKRWAHTREMTQRTLFVHLNCQSTSGWKCLCTRAQYDPVCTHDMCISVCRARGELHPQCPIQRTLFMSLFASASTYSIMAERQPLTWFSNATNVFNAQKTWPWSYRADETASEWARLAYRVLCLTPTAA